MQCGGQKCRNVIYYGDLQYISPWKAAKVDAAMGLFSDKLVGILCFIAVITLSVYMWNIEANRELSNLPCDD